MKKELQFSDFEPSELVGMYVDYSPGHWSDNQICKIIRSTKTAFEVEKSGTLFRLQDGRERGTGYNKASCRLITNEEAEKLRVAYAKRDKAKAISAHIGNNYRNFTYDQLIAIGEVIGFGKKEAGV